MNSWWLCHCLVIFERAYPGVVYMVCWKYPFAKHPSSYTDVSTQPWTCVHVYSSTPNVVKQSWLNVSDMFAEWLTLQWWISPYSQHRWFPVTSAFLWALVTQSSPWIQHLVMEKTETKNSYALQLHITYAFSTYSVSNDWMHQMVMCLYMLAFSQLAMWCDLECKQQHKHTGRVSAR